MPTTDFTFGDVPSSALGISSHYFDYSGIVQCVPEPQNEVKRNYINTHSYIPEKFSFHKNNTEEELYMGVELEVDCGGKDEDSAKYVYDFMNVDTDNVYCKHDGSLSSGFEIVTHPCTLDYHKSLPYEELFDWLTKHKYRSHDTTTCGMHVHINRDYFGTDKLSQDLCISKVLYLFEKYWDKVELIARRKSNGYARRFRLEEDETPIDLYAKSQSSDKYGAINLKHKNTVEIRIFKGTLNHNTYICTMEFVSVMAKIAKETDIYEIQFVTWDKIKSMFSNKLNNYIVEREELKKKEEEDVSKQGSDDIPAIRFNTDFLTSSGYSEALYARACQELSERMSDWTLQTISPIACSTVDSTPQSEITGEEIIRREIIDLRRRVRRCRNGLESTNLNRQIARLENDLRRMRLAV